MLCCGETLTRCFARIWVVSKSGHTFSNLSGSCVKKEKKKEKKRCHFQSVPPKHREMVSRNTICFCRGIGSMNTLSPAVLQVDACLDLTRCGSPPALGCCVCPDGTILQSTFHHSPQSTTGAPQLVSWCQLPRLLRGASQRSCLRNFFERAGCQLVLHGGYF